MRRLALIAVAGVALAGCGSSHPSSAAPSRHSRYPVAIHSPAVALAKKPLPFHALPRLVSPTRLEIATWGSYTCPGVPNKIVVTSPHSISINVGQRLKTPRGIAARRPGGCTLDLRLDRILVAINPKLVDVHHRLTIHGLSPLHFKYGVKHPKPYVPTIAPLSG